MPGSSVITSIIQSNDLKKKKKTFCGKAVQTQTQPLITLRFLPWETSRAEAEIQTDDSCFRGK